MNSRHGMSLKLIYNCHACNHVFKPKRLTKQALESRLGCPCVCHWGVNNSDGITPEQAELMYEQQKVNPVK